jgi:hypothetical protein
MMQPSRQVILLTALTLWAAGVCGFSQTTGSPYRDRQGRFSLNVPNGWTATPFPGFVQIEHGNAVASVIVNDGAQDPEALLASLSKQMEGQWKDFKKIQRAASTLGRGPAVFGVFAGLNPRGVDSLVKIVTATEGRNSFAIVMSSPTAEFMANKVGFDAIELSFSIGGAPNSASNPAVAIAPAPQRSTGRLAERALPAGFTLTRDPQGSGGVILGSFSGNARSATATAQGMLGELRGFFDAFPSISTAARSDSDRQFQALFSTSIENVPVVGVIGVELNAGGGTVAIVYDRAGHLRDSYLRLRGKSVSLQRTGLPDGSSIRLPQGWRVSGSAKGSVDVTGPNREAISLGIAAPVHTQRPNLPGGYANYVFWGPCCDPVRAMAALTPQVSALLVKTGGPSLQLLRVIDSQPTPSPVNGGQSAFIFADTSVGGRPSQQFSWVLAAPAGYGQWMYYISSISAPTEIFAAQASTMIAIWNSYSINPAVFKERMDTAIRNMNQATASILAAGRESERVRECAAERWDQVIRGVDTIENASSGRRYQVDDSYARNLVNGLNETGTGNWKVVPMDELVPRR